jgi:hypothetical protein
LFQGGIDSFMFAVGLSGMAVMDYMIGYDLDAGNKRPVEGKMEFMEKAYRMGRDLLA